MNITYSDAVDKIFENWTDGESKLDDAIDELGAMSIDREEAATLLKAADPVRFKREDERIIGELAGVI